MTQPILKAETFARQPALRRLGSLAPLDGEAIHLIEAALDQTQPTQPRRDMVAEGSAIVGARIMVSGWAARVRILSDGRRQFLSFLLPGDLFGLCPQPSPIAVSTVTALTEVKTCPAPCAKRNPSLDQAYAMSQAYEEAYLLEHIARLGRLNAQERIYGLLLELNERLSRNGLATDGGFEIPLTQEMLADALGLTPVHVNRMLQQARRAGELDWQSGRVRLRDPAMLARRIGRASVRVSLEAPAR